MCRSSRCPAKQPDANQQVKWDLGFLSVVIQSNPTLTPTPAYGNSLTGFGEKAFFDGLPTYWGCWGDRISNSESRSSKGSVLSVQLFPFRNEKPEVEGGNLVRVTQPVSSRTTWEIRSLNLTSIAFFPWYTLLYNSGGREKFFPAKNYLAVWAWDQVWVSFSLPALHFA